jgi:large subunit ribosomal protein L32
MAVPKRRQSKMKGRQRRAHYHALSYQVSHCPECQRPLAPHTACPECGTYRGRQVLFKAKATEKKPEL